MSEQLMPEQNEATHAQELIVKTIAEAKALAAEQMAAAWQLQVEKIQEQLGSGFQDHVTSLLDERFQELQSQLGPALSTEFAAREVDLRRTLIGREDELAQLKTAHAALEGALAQRDTLLADKESAFQSSLAAREQEWQSSLSAKQQEFEAALQAKQQEAEQSLAAKEAEFRAVVSSREQELQAALNAREQELQSQLQQEREQAAAREQELQAASNAREQELQAQLHQAREHAAAREQELQSSLAAKEQEFQSSLGAKEQDLQGAFEARLATRESDLKAVAEQREREFSVRIGELEHALNEARHQAEQARQNAAEQLAAALAERDNELRAQFAARESAFANQETDIAARLQEAREAAAREAQAQAEEAAHQAIHEAATAARRTAAREVSEQLNQAARRLGAAVDFSQWREALLDGAATQADRVLVFGLDETSGVVEGARGFDNALGLTAKLSDAPALTSAIDTKDTVVAVRTSSEFGEAIADLAAETKGAKVYLFPIQVKDKVVAVLYAEAGDRQIEVSALELLAAVASLSVAARRAPDVPKPATVVPVVTSAAPTTSEGLASLMTSLSREEQDLHLRAQRFARVQVAEMRLYKSGLVKEGRTKQNIYGSLRDEIDMSREAFRAQFMSSTKSMVDYFHLELVHTLANDDPALLGQDYPGPLNSGVSAHA